MRPGRAPTEFDAALGARLAEVRKAAEMSQADMAARLGCTKAAVSYWEAGKRAISAEAVVEFARVLHLDLGRLLTGEPS